MDELIEQFSRSYLPRSMWLAGETRDRIEDFAHRSREMRERFSSEVEEKGYEKVRSGMARRVSKKLGPARKQVDLALETELADPSLYAKRGQEVPVLRERLEKAKDEAKRLTARWEELESRRPATRS